MMIKNLFFIRTLNVFYQKIFATLEFALDVQELPNSTTRTTRTSSFLENSYK